MKLIGKADQVAILDTKVQKTGQRLFFIVTLQKDNGQQSRSVVTAVVRSSRESIGRHFLVMIKLILAKQDCKNTSIFFLSFHFFSFGPLQKGSQPFLTETVETGDKNRDDFHCMYNESCD